MKFKGRIFLFVGVILLAVGVIVYFAIASKIETDGGTRNLPPWGKALLLYGVSGLLAGLGLIFMVAGFKANARAKEMEKLYHHILQTGVSAEGSVTFVDKNYSIRVNKVPIYSIVEYTYKDRSGKQHTSRIDTFSSEQVIRKQIQVGGTIQIKYATENPAQSIVVL
ncbi:MAG TPA: DUF3592 domain-containing protein [Flavobacteriales bacterium]|nr:DUF3592 domain-containing protein [Flavobacteriales bacterium]